LVIICGGSWLIYLGLQIVDPTWKFWTLLQFGTIVALKKGYLIPIIIFPVFVLLCTVGIAWVGPRYSKSVRNIRQELQQEKIALQREKANLPHQIRKRIEEEYQQEKAWINDQENALNLRDFSLDEKEKELERKISTWKEELQNAQISVAKRKERISIMKGRIKQVIVFLEEDPPKTQKSIKYLKRLLKNKKVEEYTNR
jgi:hypothetical protein